MIAFSVPMKISSGTLQSTENYEEIVRGQLLDALTTNQGERVMHPDWGCDIQSMLFDPSEQLERVDTAAYVRDRLVQFVPRAFIKGVGVNADDGQPNVVYIDVAYKASTYSPTSTIQVGLDLSTPATGSSTQ